MQRIKKITNKELVKKKKNKIEEEIFYIYAITYNGA